MDLRNWVKDRILAQVSASTQRLVIAFSGGIDSSVLLHLCASLHSDLPCPLHAVYIHHGLSPNADDWQAHCQHVSGQLNIPFEAHRVKIDGGKKGTEAAAREARYRKLAEVTSSQDLLLLGQHDDDQVETFLLQLLRGAGPDGLMAMPLRRQDSHQRHYLRPLLGISKQAINGYAEQYELRWIEDESNASTQFDRNYLRHEVLPRLSSRFPASQTNILRSIGHIQEQTDMLQEIVQERLATCTASHGRALEIRQLQTFSLPWQKHIIKCWIKQQNVLQPSAAVLSQIIEHCIAAAQDATPKVQWGNTQCRRFDGYLHLVPDYEECAEFSASLKLGESVTLPNSDGYVSARRSEAQEKGYLTESLAFPLTVKYSGYSAKFKPLGARHSKPLKQWFKEWKMPPWERQRTPLIFSGEQLIQVGSRPGCMVQVVDGTDSYVTIETATSSSPPAVPGDV